MKSTSKWLVLVVILLNYFVSSWKQCALDGHYRCKSFPSLLMRRERLKTSADSNWNVRAIGSVQTCYLQKHVIPRQATIAQQKFDLIFTENHKKSLTLEELKEVSFNSAGQQIPTLDAIQPERVTDLLHQEAYNLSYVQELSDRFPLFMSPLQVKTPSDISLLIADNHPLLSIGKITVFPEFKECLQELGGFDFLWLITYMHVNSGYKKLIRPRVNPQISQSDRKLPELVGLFTSRAPHRPNPIALSALSILSVNMSEGSVFVLGTDLLNDTPILDIKPYIPAFDSFPEARAGWMDAITSNVTEARIHGYQQIYSPRGARATRAGLRKKLLTGIANTSNTNPSFS